MQYLGKIDYADVGLCRKAIKQCGQEDIITVQVNLYSIGVYDVYSSTYDRNTIKEFWNVFYKLKKDSKLSPSDKYKLGQEQENTFIKIPIEDRAVILVMKLKMLVDLSLDAEDKNKFIKYSNLLKKIEKKYGGILCKL